MRRFVIAAVVACAALTGFGIGAPGLFPAGAADRPAETIAVSLVSFKFAPDILTLHQGQRVVLQLSNDDPQPRAHSIASLFLNTVSYTVTGEARQGVTPDGVKYVLVDQHQKAEVSFVPATRGQWSMFCSVFNHAARGETGAIVVWPADYRPAKP